MRELPAAKTAAFERMVGELRGFLDKVAGAHPDEATLAALAHDLAAWSDRLAGCAVDESEQLFGRLVGEPGRGQTMMPRLVLEDARPGEVRGHVVFGRYFLGVNGAAHGGALALVFDEVLGVAAAAPDRVRTAYLHVDFRALTPLDTRLEVRGWLDRQEGRKRFVRGELRCGEVVCAEAEALFVELKPEQA
jgi:acyl-coenzyme A thioesterase PaaI-like protein